MNTPVKIISQSVRTRPGDAEVVLRTRFRHAGRKGVVSQVLRNLSPVYSPIFTGANLSPAEQCETLNAALEHFNR